MHNVDYLHRRKIQECQVYLYRCWISKRAAWIWVFDRWREWRIVWWSPWICSIGCYPKFDISQFTGHILSKYIAQAFDEASSFFDALFLSSPLLERFEIERRIGLVIHGSVGLRIDLSNLVCLKHVKIEIYGISHYKFNVPEKKDITICR